MADQSPKSRDGRIQTIITSSFSDVAQRISAGVSVRLAVAQVLAETLERLEADSLTLAQNEYLLWENALSIFAEQQAQLYQKQQASEPQRNQTRAGEVILGTNTKTKKDVSITDEERQSGVHILGATGTGKSTTLTGMFLGDILNGHGGLFVDVDGDSISQLLPRIPKERMHDVVLLDLAALAKKGRYIGINPLPALNEKAAVDTDAAIDRYMHVFKLLWNIGKETPRLENTLRASLLTLAINGQTIAEMPFLLREKEFRKRCIEAIPVTFATEGLRSFWKHDFDALYVQEQLKYADSTLNKVLQFLMVEKVLYAVSQGKTTIDFRTVMDKGNIVLLKLNPQEIGETAVRFLGAFLMAELKNAVFSRADVERSERPFFSLIADEWQLYLTADFKDTLTRGRKYGFAAAVANQTFSQLDEIDTALQGITKQVNTHITFAVNEKDAAILAPYYARDPEPGEPRLENKRIISPTPVNTVVLGKPHTKDEVNSYFSNWREIVRTARSFIHEGSTPDTSTIVATRRGTKKYVRPGRSWSNRGAVEGSQALLDIINDVLHQVMTEKKPYIPFPPDLLSTGHSQFRDYVAMLEKDPTVAQVEAYNRLWEVHDDQFAAACQLYEQTVRAFLRERIAPKVKESVETALMNRRDPSYQAYDIFAGRMQAYYEERIVISFDDLRDLPIHVQYEETWEGQLEMTALYCQPDRTSVLPSITSTATMSQIIFQTVPYIRTLSKATTAEIDQQEVGQTLVQAVRFTRNYLIQRYRAVKTAWLQKKIAEYAGFLKEIGKKDRDKEKLEKGIEALKQQWANLDREIIDKIMVWEKDLYSSLDGSWDTFFSPKRVLSDPRLSANAWMDTIRTELVDQLYKIMVNRHSRLSVDGTEEVYLWVKIYDAKEYIELEEAERKDIKAFLLASSKQWKFRFYGHYTCERQIEVDIDTQSAIELLFPSTPDEKKRKALAVTFPYPWGQLIIDKIQAEVDRMVSEQKCSFEDVIKEIREVMAILAQEPIMELSSVLEEKPGTQRTFADMEKEKAKELLGLPNGIAYVAIRSRGDRFRPRIETKPFPFLHPALATKLLEERRAHALKNAEAYTTEAQTISLEVLKRRQQFGIAPSPVTQTSLDTDALAVPAPTPYALRRTHQFALSLAPQFHVPDTTSEDDLLMLLYLFTYLTITQLARVLQKETSVNNIREKVNKLVASGFVEAQPLPRTSSGGRSALVYTLSAKGLKKLGDMKGFTPDATRKRGGFTQHTLLVNDVLISATLLGKVEPRILLTHLEHERVLKQHPVSIGNNKAVIPDGFVSYSLSQPYGVTGEIIGLVCELDTGSENAYQWREKLTNYALFAAGPYQERFGINSLTIAVIVPGNDQARISELVDWTKKIFANKKHFAELFLFAACDPATLDPLSLFTSPLFTQSFDTTKHALIETLV